MCANVFSNTGNHTLNLIANTMYIIKECLIFSSEYVIFMSEYDIWICHSQMSYYLQSLHRFLLTDRV